LQDIRDLLNAGADKVSIMTAAVHDPDLIADAAAKIGSANLVLAIDARAVRDETGAPVAGRWEVHTHGGRRPTGIDAVEWAARNAEAGAGEILLTSMDRDGTKSGYDLDLLRAVADRVPIPVIASGGGGSAADLASALSEGPEGGTPRPPSPPRSSTSARRPWPRSSGRSRSAASRCGCLRAIADGCPGRPLGRTRRSARSLECPCGLC